MTKGSRGHSPRRYLLLCQVRTHVGVFSWTIQGLYYTKLRSHEVSRVYVQSSPWNLTGGFSSLLTRGLSIVGSIGCVSLWNMASFSARIRLFWNIILHAIFIGLSLQVPSLWEYTRIEHGRQISSHRQSKLGQCWPNVETTVPTLGQRSANLQCYLR